MGSAALDISSIDSLADALSEEVREGDTVKSMPVGDLKRGKYQPRGEIKPSSLKSLVESIKSQGVLLPLLIRPLPDESHEIVAGERRWRASMLAGLETVPCIIRDIDDDTALASALIENIDREDFTLVEEAKGVVNLVDKTSSKTAAKILGKSAQWVSKRCKIARAPEYIIAFATLGLSTDVEGLYQLSRLAEKDEKAAKSLVDLWTKDPTTRASLRQQVLDLLSPKESKQSPALPNNPLPEGNTPSAKNDSSSQGQRQGGGKKAATQSADKTGSSKTTTVSSGHEDNDNQTSSEPTHKSSLPPVTITSAIAYEGYLVCETNEGVIRFKLSSGAKSLILKALKQM